MVLWFTGLSGSGKTTLGESTKDRLVEGGLEVSLIDGDQLRQSTQNHDFSKQGRSQNVRRAADMAAKEEQKGKLVIVCLISPYREDRAYAETVCQEFAEIYMSADLKTCEARDPKGLYRRARNGEIQQFTGIDDPYEHPVAPAIEIDSAQLGVDQSVTLIMDFLGSRGIGV